MIIAFPLGVSLHYRRFPLATCFLAALLGAVYAALALSELPHVRVADFWQLPAADLIHYGVAFVPAEARLGAFLLAPFVHAGLLHLLGNLLFLWLLGCLVEDALGWWKYLLVYFGGGILTTAIHSMAAPMLAPPLAEIPVAGASGAVSVLIGVFASGYGWTNLRIGYFVWAAVYTNAGFVAVNTLLAVWVWLAASLLFGTLALFSQSSSVAYIAHLAGFALGWALAELLGVPKNFRRPVFEITSPMGPLRRRLEEAAAWPNNIAAQLAAAREWVKTGDAEAAAPYFAQAVRLLLLENRREAARRYLEAAEAGAQLAFTPEESLELAASLEEISATRFAAEVLSRAQLSDRTLFRLAQLYADKLDDAAAAEQAFRRMLETFPDSPLHSLAEDRLSALQRR